MRKPSPMRSKVRDEFARRALALWRDTDGLMVPYVAVMLPVLVGFALLALDASRRMSLQTQMQAAADSLALAGARELNKQPGAEARAISAMANAHAATKSSNTLFGVGSSPTLDYTFVFYSSLLAASDGIGGGLASGDSDAKYVAVKITPQTWSTVLPATFLANISTRAFAVGADAVAGFAGTSVCSVAPIFVCNPYEQSAGSMTDAQATAALYSAFDNPAMLRRQLKLNRNGVGPGHFGWLKTADGCNDATCMAKNVASAAGACYSDAGVSLAIGNNNAVEPYFDTRFDIYNQNLPLASPSADPPAVNVRKGYLPGHKSNAVDWCSATPASGSNLYYTYPSNRTVGATTQNSPILTNVANSIGITTGEPVLDFRRRLREHDGQPRHSLQFRRRDGHGLDSGRHRASLRRPHDRMDDERIARGHRLPQPRRRRGQRPVGLRRLLGHQSSPWTLGCHCRNGARRGVWNSGPNDGQPIPGLPI